MSMTRNVVAVTVGLFISLAVSSTAQRRPEITQAEIRQAALEVPELAVVLQLRPGMAVGDVGAGGGAMTASFSKWLGPDGRVYATEVTPARLAEIRDLVARERLDNVTTIEGTQQSSNLPAACCDAVFLRDVYHHLTEPASTNNSLFAALKPGGRLAIIDFEPQTGSTVPAGVPSNRDGHGIRPPLIVSELTAAGFRHVRTLSAWPPADNRSSLFLVLFEKPD
jgi:predicted methyltransferase